MPFVPALVLYTSFSHLPPAHGHTVSGPPFLHDLISVATRLSSIRRSKQCYISSPPMESNKDEALKCLSIAQKHRNAGNLPSARRFCQKSLNLFATPEAHKLLEIIESETSSSEASSTASSSSSSSASTSSGAETHPSAAGTRHRHTTEANGKPNGFNETSKVPESQPEKKRDYTPEQAAVVKRIQSCKVTEYYEILSVKRDCEEVDIKKAYRKVRVCQFTQSTSYIDSIAWVCQLALYLHPDKNGAPGADEAFKSESYNRRSTST